MDPPPPYVPITGAPFTVYGASIFMNAGLSFAVGADASIPNVAHSAVDNPAVMHAIAVIRARLA